ncbi:hypothetical protein [Streptomyces sp. NBRC 110611]|uniref:hypothetical protein n=1 Tax=Streptomyces sp. NBRC 110611 TaxID=1621259 RepID=UPI00215BB3D8|nr:hypothetical protein [Streptomyces sp. NBRC 110611]
MALAIAVSRECDECVAAHAHAVVLQRATPPEAAETLGVTFLLLAVSAPRVRLPRHLVRFRQISLDTWC